MTISLTNLSLLPLMALGGVLLVWFLAAAYLAFTWNDDNWVAVLFDIARVFAVLLTPIVAITLFLDLTGAYR